MNKSLFPPSSFSELLQIPLHLNLLFLVALQNAVGVHCCVWILRNAYLNCMTCRLLGSRLKFTPGWLAFNQGAVPHRPHSGTVRPEMRGSLLVSWQFIFSIHFFICLTFLAQLTERPSLLNDLVPVTWALTLKTTATSLRCTHHAASVSVLVHLRYQRWLQCKFSPQKWLMSSLQEKNILGSLVQF